MTNILHHPLIIFTVSVFTLWLSGRLGRLMIRKRRQLDEELRSDFIVNQGAALTLLALIIGFSFSMSAARYDLRKNREATEANAIGTGYVRSAKHHREFPPDACPAGSDLHRVHVYL